MIAARENPFRSARQRSLRYRLEESDWTALVQRLAALDHRAALVGPHGSGKTTLLEELEARLSSAGWQIRRLRFDEAHPRPERDEWRAAFAGADRRTLLTVDGAEQLDVRHWWRIRFAARRLGGLVVTAHRSGLLPTLREHHTDPALLGVLVAELVEPAAAAALRPALPAIFDAHHGDLRRCLRHLYDLAAAAGALR